MARGGMFLVSTLLLIFFLSGSNSCFTNNYSESTKIKVGSSYYQECQCDGAGKTGINLKWLDSQNEEILPLGPGTRSNVYSEWLNQDTYSVYITNITKSISGAYKCVTNYDGQQYALTYNLEAYDSPYFINTKKNQYVVNGRDALINCEVGGEADPLITWYKEQEGFIEITDDDKYEITENGLKIKKLTTEDGGVYKCAASDLETGEGIERDITVEVISPPKIQDLTVTPDIEVYAGDEVAIQCLASGIPPPEYSWRKVSDVESSDQNITWTQTGNRIEFTSVVDTDQGTYECTAINSVGNQSKTIEIQVLLAPVVTQFENVSAAEGSTTQIACKASGRPIPKVNIIFLGEESNEQSIVWDIKNVSDTDVEFYLTFFKVNRTHDGTYICNVSNEVDFSVKEMQMTVLFPPQFDKEEEIVWGWKGKTANFSCENHSKPQAETTWRYHKNDITADQATENSITPENLQSPWLVPENQTLYGIYECTAKNYFGEAKKMLTFQEGFVPPVVTNISILNITATTATFTIDIPEIDNGPEIIGFTSEYDELDNYNITDIHINRTWSIHRPYKIDKLKSNTSYLIKFAAINEVGSGMWSEVIDFMTLEKPLTSSFPGEPTWETDADEAASDLVLKWKTDNDEAIDYFIIRSCPVFNGTVEETLCEEYVETSNEFHLNEMDSNITYYFELVAHNSLGNSSALNVFVTLPAEKEPLLSAGGIIGISIVVVFICLVLLDLLLLMWRRQGILANCCYKKKKNRNEETLNSRDKKGLLKDGDGSKQPGNGHKEYEYNKTTGVITGKHSAV